MMSEQSPLLIKGKLDILTDRIQTNPWETWELETAEPSETLYWTEFQI